MRLGHKFTIESAEHSKVLTLGLEEILDELIRQNHGNIHYTGHIVNKSLPLLRLVVVCF